MHLDLSPLFDRAFLSADAARANDALAEARAQQGDKRSYEVLVPAQPDLAWLEDTLARRLVYFCESTRAPLPACAGVFVSFFAGERLYCVAASEVIAFACDLLDTTPGDLVQRFGTGEVRHALRRDS